MASTSNEVEADYGFTRTPTPLLARRRQVSWPYGPTECPRCRFFEGLDPPVCDDEGYEIVGLCLHPRIAMELFRLRQRDPYAIDSCPCFSEKRPGQSR